VDQDQRLAPPAAEVVELHALKSIGRAAPDAAAPAPSVFRDGQFVTHG
jgi:hypothetical protein